jgi:hypothetical protein
VPNISASHFLLEVQSFVLFLHTDMPHTALSSLIRRIYRLSYFSQPKSVKRTADQTTFLKELVFHDKDGKNIEVMDGQTNEKLYHIYESSSWFYFHTSTIISKAEGSLPAFTEIARAEIEPFWGEPLVFQGKDILGGSDGFLGPR